MQRHILKLQAPRTKQGRPLSSVLSCVADAFYGTSPRLLFTCTMLAVVCAEKPTTLAGAYTSGSRLLTKLATRMLLPVPAK